MRANRSEQELLSEISAKLDIVVGFLAIRGMENDHNAMIKKLSDLGLHAKVIGQVTGLSENAVRIRMSRGSTKKRVKKQTSAVS